MPETWNYKTNNKLSQFKGSIKLDHLNYPLYSNAHLLFKNNILYINNILYMNKSLRERLSEYLFRPIKDINKKDLENFSKYKLIKMLLESIVVIYDLETYENMISSLSKHGVLENLNKKTKSEIIRLILEKEKNRPKIQINYIDTTYKIKKHIPGSNIIIDHTGYLFIELMTKLRSNQDIEFVCDTVITACQ